MQKLSVIIGLHIVLYFTDNLPITHVAFSIVCHLVYLSNFSPSWPFISLTSPRFILSCILVVGDHFVWFFHFAAVAQEAKHYRVPKYRYGGQQVKAASNNPSFGDVAAFFAICVWFVPLYLFLSLSANDNALPSFVAKLLSMGHRRKTHVFTSIQSFPWEYDALGEIKDSSTA
ncbi:hypothetical protein I307_00712 [Cryptococcus deuterogattii 99/473]|uniref:Uncharacterized protein n=1 Tax=Cryptococcus deuterogattii Ram5 TaxID=1296110 RepID=A0A0D0V4A6_9TREE|nr:hypothetical protein I309_00381 [Cryptococcus deuterogattii LA55]KIR31494.1 hypothetical protein I352_06133 [Cryptococcus deuterogattii MMRL2647]KIR42236.1 hypothetical protein I313_01457 [Cryptococcus deuterogattii Ram5]KIR72939.1 hypothetical protein I310_03544 [Cryptococcus deuterogattii CA1014]KIR94882.1 hypothetical protein I304_01205 [Cryptococcus deuterogattii CBS 10090]KIS00598.1 hypothetical protein L804_02014 [Cryptococcus deuterogattii 2001/935-1]KIY59641.1 hypothetical protein 